jgi:hypothetical protein
MFKDFNSGGALPLLLGSAYIVWYFRALGATIGENCGMWVGGKNGLMTEPDLIEVIIFWNCSLFVHISSCRSATMSTWTTAPPLPTSILEAIFYCIVSRSETNALYNQNQGYSRATMW